MKSSMQPFNRVLVVAGLSWWTALGGSLHAQQAPPDSPPQSTPVGQPAAGNAQDNGAAPAGEYLRVAEARGHWIALEIATRRFERAQGGPAVALVGVTHIADADFYSKLQELLNSYDVVLYESVKPPGTGAPGDTDEERIAGTKAAIEFVAGLIAAHRQERGELPPSLEQLREFVAGKDARMAGFLAAATVDGWGRPLAFALAAGAADPQRGFTLISLGADGQPGGEGSAADISSNDLPLARPFDLVREDNLQQQLADALGLKFQLKALGYDLPSWRCSDMSMDQVTRRLAARGLDFGPLGGTLAGTSLPAKLVSFFLGIMRVADGFMQGAIADTFKVVLIEVLSDASMIDQSLAQLGKGFGEVIINDRNQVVIDDLKRMMSGEPQVKSVAILYGAGHMNDLAQRLQQQLGYKPAGEQWLRAISVDFSRSAVSPVEINRIRAMMKQAMRQQLQRAGGAGAGGGEAGGK